MKQRRERFLLQIRRKEREQIKNKLRMQFLSELDDQKSSATTEVTPFHELERIYSMFDKPCSQESPDKSESSKFSVQLQCILEQFTGRSRQIKTAISPQQFLVTFSQHLIQNNDKSCLQAALEFYELALRCKEEYFGSISYFKRQILEVQIIITWNSLFNMLFLILYHVKHIKSYVLAPEAESLFNFYFEEWIQRICITIELQFEENIQYNIFCHQSIIQGLKEISVFIGVCVQRSFHKPLLQMLNDRMINVLQRSLFSYRIDQVGNILITSILLQVVKAHLIDLYRRIIQGDLLNTIRYMIQFQLNIDSSITTLQLKQQREVFNNILEFICEGCYLGSSDIYWSQGICTQLRARLSEGINDKILYYDIVTVIFVCITQVQDEESLTLMNQSDTFEWVLRILRKCIEERAYDPDSQQLIVNAINIIEFFISIEGTNNLERNAYFLRLRYCTCIQLLESFEKGVQFLERIGYMQQTVNNLV